MSYKILAPEQFLVAEQVRKYLSNDLGVSKLKVEESIDNTIDYRPTFLASTHDHHLLCVDVSENLINSTRSNFISQCERQGKPIKFYVAIAFTGYPGFDKELKEAKRLGIGILEVNTVSKTCSILSQPLSLSLTALRRFETQEFPKKYRQGIVSATELFKSGEPNKACSLIYDELESLCRQVAVKSYNDGAWKVTIKNPKNLKDKMAWSTVITHLRDDLDRKTKYGIISEQLMSRLHGITTYRNDSGHKSLDIKQLQLRDTQLRTRIESAIDLLHEFVSVHRKL